jgi:hypothetical protein
MTEKVETIIDALTGEITIREIIGEELEALRIEGERIRSEQVAFEQAKASLKASAKDKLIAGEPLSAEEAEILVF